MTSPPLITFVGVAHPWMCDTMGHMNVRYYAGMFDDAAFQFLGYVAGPHKVGDIGLGWADVRTQTDYKHETNAGDLVTVSSHVTQIGKSSISFEQIMKSSLDEVVNAVNQTTTVRFDLRARRSTELDAGIRERAGLLLIQTT